MFKVKDLSSLVRYDDSSLAAIRHVQSIIPLVRPRPNIPSHSVLFSYYFRFFSANCFAQLTTLPMQIFLATTIFPHAPFDPYVWQIHLFYRTECFNWPIHGWIRERTMKWILCSDLASSWKIVRYSFLFALLFRPWLRLGHKNTQKKLANTKPFWPNKLLFSVFTGVTLLIIFVVNIFRKSFVVG